MPRLICPVQVCYWGRMLRSVSSGNPVIDQPRTVSPITVHVAVRQEGQRCQDPPSLKHHNILFWSHMKIPPSACHYGLQTMLSCFSAFPGLCTNDRNKYNPCLPLFLSDPMENSCWSWRVEEQSICFVAAEANWREIHLTWGYNQFS